MGNTSSFQFMAALTASAATVNENLRAIYDCNEPLEQERRSKERTMMKGHP